MLRTFLTGRASALWSVVLSGTLSRAIASSGGFGTWPLPT
jgi:hypothetical protein